MKGALARDDSAALGAARLVMVAARQLDHTLHRFGARVAEEDPVREAVRGQTLRQSRRLRDIVEVGHMPQLARLLGQGGDQMGVGMAERVDRDAGGEIEIAPPVGGEQIGALAALESDIGTGVGRHQGVAHETAPTANGFPRKRLEQLPAKKP